MDLLISIIKTILDKLETLLFNTPEPIILWISAFLTYFLYQKNKYDFKSNQAKIILSEIESAEKILSELREEKNKLNDPKVFYSKILNVNTWKSQKHLFISDFSDKEINTINNFFDECESIDQYLEQLSVSSQYKEKAHEFQRGLSQIIVSYVNINSHSFEEYYKNKARDPYNPNFLETELENRLKFYIDKFPPISNKFYIFQIQEKILTYLEKINLVGNSPIEEKFKKMTKFNILKILF